ncbi:hypothetical protein TUZN_0659 [Thermoproteus uzoniensis 768-20]|uniref:Uncharacterized protein n=1 Tax=Thermoproteus uzoniensis (strain 768-20) TaxID=999630 RepID=F2L495_THEU7|nr:hypothetical protein TUZN_0659 [Thermoproteus uzoniensis 768-20]
MKSLKKVRVSALNIDPSIKQKLIEVLGENEVVYIDPDPYNEKIRIIL